MINYIKDDYTHMTGQHCVYRIWFNEYYYIGCTSNLEKRINQHFCVTKRLSRGLTTAIKTRKAYRKLIKLINLRIPLNITAEVLLTGKSLKESTDYERSLHYERHACPFMINNVRKKFSKDNIESSEKSVFSS